MQPSCRRMTMMWYDQAAVAHIALCMFCLLVYIFMAAVFVALVVISIVALLSVIAMLVPLLKSALKDIWDAIIN